MTPSQYKALDEKLNTVLRLLSEKRVETKIITKRKSKKQELKEQVEAHIARKFGKNKAA